MKLSALGPLPDRAVVAGVAAVGLYVGFLSWGMSNWPYDFWGGIIVAPLLMLLTWPILVRVGRADNDSWAAKVMLLALVVKFAVSLTRYQSIFTLYEGTGDASVYNRNGRRLAPLYWDGFFDAKVGWPHFIGAGFIIVVTAIIYMIIGPTLIGGFFVFSWFAFLGLVLAYRAFRIALPDGDHRRYLVLIMFLPSLLYWPSSLGKDAFMVLALGLCLNGAARLLTHRRGGFLVLGLGLAAALMVRPHVAAIAIAGLSVGFLLRPPARRTSLTPIVRVGGLVVIMALAGFVTLRAATFLGIEEVSVSGVSESIDEQSSRTSGGDSAFTPNPATNPANIPMAFVTVLFRPFPQEAHNSQTLLAAAEGLLALLLVARSWRQLLTVPRLLRREPYVALCLVFVVAFVVAFSSFSNFGILARERAQLWPVFLALLCVPLPVTAQTSPRDVAARRHDVEPYQRARVPA